MPALLLRKSVQEGSRDRRTVNTLLQRRHSKWKVFVVRADEELTPLQKLNQIVGETIAVCQGTPYVKIRPHPTTQVPVL